jgi:DNA-binding NarL/FixJ family response regulator
MIRVVVADDEINVRESLTIVLEAAGDIAVVATAPDAGDVVALARSLSPEVVVMDMRMPGFEGVAAMSCLHPQRVGPAVLALTTIATEETAWDAIRAGAAGFCAKSDASGVLIRAVRALANGRFSISPSVLWALLARVAALGEAPAAVFSNRARCSSREVEVLCLVAEGADNGEIARRLAISDATVRTHLYHLRTKLQVRTRAQLVVKAYELGSR